MSAPELPDANPDDPRTPAGDEPNSASMAAFMRALAAFQNGMSANNAEQTEAAALDALRVVAEEAEKNPSPALVLKLEAGECEARGDWAGAEACYRKVLALQEATGNFALISRAHQHLSRLFLLVGDLEAADACGQAATATARQTDIFPVQVMALENQVICALRRSDYGGALQAASDAVAVVEPDRMYDGMRAGALVTRARCRLACGDVEGAERDLATCKPVLLDRDVSPIMAGSHSKAAGWWEVAAGIRAHQGDRVGATEAWTETVKRRRHVASLEQVSGPYTQAALARTLRHWGKALDAAGKPVKGKTALEEAQNIWCELGLPEQAVR